MRTVESVGPTASTSVRMRHNAALLPTISSKFVSLRISPVYSNQRPFRNVLEQSGDRVHAVLGILSITSRSSPSPCCGSIPGPAGAKLGERSLLIILFSAHDANTPPHP